MGAKDGASVGELVGLMVGNVVGVLVGDKVSAEGLADVVGSEGLDDSEGIEEPDGCEEGCDETVAGAEEEGRDDALEGFTDSDGIIEEVGMNVG